VSNETINLVAPEIILVLAGTLVYLGGAFVPSRTAWGWLAAAAIVLAGVVLYQQGMTPAGREALVHGAASGPITIDQFSALVRYVALAVALVFVMVAFRWSEADEASEFMGSLLMITAGLMLVALANDLVLVFVGLELVSIPTYLILYLGRGGNLLESGTKYFFLSILSSALLLYGFSFLYGAAGSTSLVKIAAALAGPGPETRGMGLFAQLAIVLVFAGLSFRLTAVPFHFYAPDVYQGTTHANAGLLAVVPKIAALAALVRLAYVAMPGFERLAWQLTLALAMVTMTTGNLLALWQTNVRRLMAYSSIAHAGYMLIGLSVGFAVAGGAAEAKDFDGTGATLFYLVVYAAATAGTFAALAWLSSERRAVDRVEQLAGLSASHPKTAAAIAVFMLSLTGLPPLAGFWGKLTLFTGALSVDARDPDAGGLWPWFLALAVVGALNAAISAGYYLRIVGAMYFQPAESVPEAQGGRGPAWAAAVCALLVLAIGCYPGPMVEHANQASRAVRQALDPPAFSAAAAPRRPSRAARPSPAPDDFTRPAQRRTADDLGPR
jgi:NADH-quinone oxidoreductase subunit N